MPRFSTAALAAGGVAALSAAAMLPAAAAAQPALPHTAAIAAKTVAKHHPAKSALKFSHEVVVDEQVSGFEPDILADTKDRLYTSVPNGSSQGTSYVWVSRDHGKSFKFVAASAPTGKPFTCDGGGDTELELDHKNNLYFSDLQNLTNLSNSVSKNQGKTFSTTCTGAANTPVDRMWYAIHGNLGDPHFVIYEEYDAVASGTDPNGPGGNQLVEEVSHDGTNFIPVLNPNFSSGCLGGGSYNCVSDDEGISGNQLVTPQGKIFIGHNGSDGNQIKVSYATPKNTFSGGQLTQSMANWTTKTVNHSICPDAANKAKGICGASQFVTVDRDTSGAIYASFSSAKLDKDGNQVGPYGVYVVHSTNSGKTWSKPQRVSGIGSNSFSWITAGSKGRVAMAWYHPDQPYAMVNGKKSYVFDDLSKAEFSVQVAESTNALSKHPKYHVKTVSEHPIKYGPICTAGTSCLATGGDRSLGDFLEVRHDTRGALVLSYVDDTSNTYTSTTGSTSGTTENGPAVVVRQVAGPSLIKGKANRKGVISGPGKGPGRAMSHIGDRTKDAYFPSGGAYNTAGANQDLTRASVSKDKKGFVVHLKVRSLKSLSVPSSVGGSNAQWMLRFTTYNRHTLGNGHIYYAGMESSSGGTPHFFDGDTAAPAEQVQLGQTFSSSHATKGSFTKKGAITIHVPFKDVPGAAGKKGHKAKSTLYSATGFTSTTTKPLTSGSPTGEDGQLHMIDRTAPFNYAYRYHAKKKHHARAAVAATSHVSHRNLAGGLISGAGIALLALAVLRLMLATTRRRVVLAR